MTTVNLFSDEAIGADDMAWRKYAWYSFLRFWVAALLVPLWLICGLLSFGMLWPPQIKMERNNVKCTSDAECVAQERKQQITKLESEAKKLRRELEKDTANVYAKDKTSAKRPLLQKQAVVASEARRLVNDAKEAREILNGILAERTAASDHSTGSSEEEIVLASSSMSK